MSLVNSIVPLFLTTSGTAVFIAPISPYIPIDSSSSNLIEEFAVAFSSVVTFCPYIPTAFLPCIVIEPLLIPLLLPPPVLLVPSSFVYIPIASCALVDTIVPSFRAVEPAPNVAGTGGIELGSPVPLTAAKATCVSVVNVFPDVRLTSDLFAANKAIVEAAAPCVIV